MTVREFIEKALANESVQRDVEQVKREHGVRELRYLEPESEAVSRFAPIELMVDFEPGRSALDLLSLEGDLEMLLQHRIKLITRGGLAASRLNQIIEESVSIDV